MLDDASKSAHFAEPTDYEGEFTKCLISGERKNLSALKCYVEKKAGDIFDLFYSSETYLELVKKGVSKGNALAATAQEANVPACRNDCHW